MDKFEILEQAYRVVTRYQDVIRGKIESVRTLKDNELSDAAVAILNGEWDAIEKLRQEIYFWKSTGHPMSENDNPPRDP